MFRDNTSINSTIHSVREALRRGKPRSRWLLIFDDVRQPDDIMRYLPIAGPGTSSSRHATSPGRREATSRRFPWKSSACRRVLRSSW